MQKEGIKHLKGRLRLLDEESKDKYLACLEHAKFLSGKMRVSDMVELITFLKVSHRRGFIGDDFIELLFNNVLGKPAFDMFLVFLDDDIEFLKNFVFVRGDAEDIMRFLSGLLVKDLSINNSEFLCEVRRLISNEVVSPAFWREIVRLVNEVRPQYLRVDDMIIFDNNDFMRHDLVRMCRRSAQLLCHDKSDAVAFLGRRLLARMGWSVMPSYEDLCELFVSMTYLISSAVRGRL